MNEKLLLWKKIGRYSFICMVICLVVKMLFKQYYGDIGMIATNIIGGLSIVLCILSEILIYKNKKNER